VKECARYTPADPILVESQRPELVDGYDAVLPRGELRNDRARRR
jgi:hypothetical protein